MFLGFYAANCFKGARRIPLLHLSPSLLWEIMCSSEVNCKHNKFLGLGFFFVFPPLILMHHLLVKCRKI